MMRSWLPRRFHPALIMLLAAGCSTLQSDTELRAERIEQAVVPMARAALAAGQIETARRLYTRLADIAPDTHAVHMGFGDIELAAGRPSRAAAWYRHAATAAPTRSERHAALLAHARASLAAGSVDAARDSFSRLADAAEQARPGVAAWGHNGLAVVAMLDGDPAVAVRFVEQAVRLAPDEPRFRDNYGRALAVADAYRAGTPRAHPETTPADRMPAPARPPASTRRIPAHGTPTAVGTPTSHGTPTVAADTVDGTPTTVDAAEGTPTEGTPTALAADTAAEGTPTANPRSAASQAGSEIETPAAADGAVPADPVADPEPESPGSAVARAETEPEPDAVEVARADTEADAPPPDPGLAADIAPEPVAEAAQADDPASTPDAADGTGLLADADAPPAPAEPAQGGVHPALAAREPAQTNPEPAQQAQAAAPAPAAGPARDDAERTPPGPDRAPPDGPESPASGAPRRDALPVGFIVRLDGLEYLQVGAFSVAANARRLAERLPQLTDLPVGIAPAAGDGLHRVRIGPLNVREALPGLMRSLAAAPSPF